MKTFLVVVKPRLKQLTQLIMILMPTMALGISVDLRKGFCVWIYVVVV